MSAKAILALPETRALATAGHSICASFGHEDHAIPLELTLDLLGRTVEATGDVPVSADLEDGYEDPAETTRRGIGVGVVGANIEDWMRPVADSAARVKAVLTRPLGEGVPFLLNARTDALWAAGDRPFEESITDAIERGRAYLAAGADIVFVPGIFDAAVTRQLVEGIGERMISLRGGEHALGAHRRGVRSPRVSPASRKGRLRNVPP